MSDEVDKANEHRDALEDAEVQRIRAAASRQVVSWPGECEECGEEHPRLVKWICPRCRDKLKLP